MDAALTVDSNGDPHVVFNTYTESSNYQATRTTVVATNAHGAWSSVPIMSRPSSGGTDDDAAYMCLSITADSHDDVHVGCVCAGCNDICIADADTARSRRAGRRTLRRPIDAFNAQML